MKKQKLVMFIILILTVPVLFSAVPESGIIKFNGIIETGLYFYVGELTSDSFNLLTEEDLQPKGPGVDIGTWTLRADNPPTEKKSFTIEYTFGPLKSVGIDDEIEFEILERADGSAVTSAVVKNTTGTTLIEVGDGPLTTFTKTVAARLTPDGIQTALVAAASSSYQSNITVTLLAE